MKLAKSAFLIILFSTIFITGMAAQKYGHLNSGNLIMSIPEAQSAEKELVAYRSQLIEAWKKKGQALQADALKLKQEYDTGNLSKLKAQERQAALAKREEELRKEEMEIGQKIEKRREELLKPIFAMIDAALKELGKEHGYTMIFDTSIFNALLYVKESDDVMALIKEKLKQKHIRAYLSNNNENKLPNKSNVVKMEKKNENWIIKAKVNGVDMDMIFDTGASSVSLSLTEAMFLLKQNKILPEHFVGNVYFKTADGKISEGMEIILEEIIIGNKTLHNVKATVVSNLEAPILLGNTALNKFVKYEVDTKEGTITFH